MSLGKWCLLLAAVCQAGAQGVSSTAGSSRQVSPAVLIFFIDQIGVEQYQQFYVAADQNDILHFTPEESCRNWILIPTTVFRIGVLGAVARTPGSFNCNVAIA